jgi:hypothetical protein
LLVRLIGEGTSSERKGQLGDCKDGSPDKMSYSAGWSVIQGKFDDILPDNNLFLLFYESLPSSILINQLVAFDLLRQQYLLYYRDVLLKNLHHKQRC